MREFKSLITPCYAIGARKGGLGVISHSQWETVTDLTITVNLQNLGRCAGFEEIGNLLQIL